MSSTQRVGIIIGIVIATAMTAIACQTASSQTDQSEPIDTPHAAGAPGGLPLLVDLGSDICRPCKLMEPILEELKDDYADKFTVEFINVRKDPDAAKPYKISLIPTQIFYDPSGRELYRHVGFISKEDILSKWGELGFDF